MVYLGRCLPAGSCNHSEMLQGNSWCNVCCKRTMLPLEPVEMGANFFGMLD
jgi:hypothetical protein